MVYLVILSIALLVALFFSPFRLWIDYRHRGRTEDSMFLQFSALAGLYCHTVQVPIMHSSKKGLVLTTVTKRERQRHKVQGPQLGGLGHFWRQLMDKRPLFIKLYPVYRRRLKVKSFRWQTEVGLEDSFPLAILTGSLWAVKGVVLASLCRNFKFRTRPVIRVLPHFGENCLRFSVSCILEIPLGYAIITAFYALFGALKLRLKRRGANDGRTSNPRADEDCHGKHQGHGRCEHCNR